MKSKFSIPLYSPRKNTANNFGFVVADVRRKNSFLAFAEYKEGNITLSNEEKYNTQDFSSMTELLQKFIDDHHLYKVEKISIAVPGPVINGKCETQNLPWLVDCSVLEKELGMKSAHIINDLEAISYSFLEFDKNLLEILHTSENSIQGNVAVLAPGNGLGEAGMFWDGENLHPFATEGGHTEFSPRNDFEVKFYQFLNKIYGIVTWENVLSKEGLYNIYRFLRDIGRHSESDELKSKIANQDFVTVIAEMGRTGKCRLVNLTIEMYAEFLAREANNLVLKLKAIGALIITGDIPNQLFDVIKKEKFYKDFIISDKMQHILKDIPIYLVRNSKGILQGVTMYGAFIQN